MTDRDRVCPACGQPMPAGGEAHPASCPACGSPLDDAAAAARAEGEDAAIFSSRHPPLGARAYAGLWRRAVALAIDTTVLWLGSLPLGLLAAGRGAAHGGTGLGGGRAGMVGLEGLGVWLYFAALESSGWSGTPGKRVLGLRVTDSSGAHIRFGRATGRLAGKLLSAVPLGLGFLMAAFTARRQALHDLLAGTLVVR
ncbi:MAG TPA: RDD family protein [Candidatus Eisenbacteria bacterium]